ncbi:hypothetical protein DITRI_Ditri02bG0032400 [Diplodiscus trichospermus]
MDCSYGLPWRNFVRTHVNYGYPEAKIIQSDSELNAWYYESIYVGHADVFHASWWWPQLSSPSSPPLSGLHDASAHHAAANFGMYRYGGFFPARPPYELLLPSLGPGLTCRGVPSSVSI